MEYNLYRYSPLEWILEKLRNIWQIEFNQWNKIKCGLKIASFVSDVFAAVADMDKLPIKIRELRTAMLCKVDLKLARTILLSHMVNPPVKKTW